jgi:eukaryotic-like serine/threonine-protein kinase
MAATPNELPNRPAEMLAGLELSGRWKVVERIPSLPGGTGSSFSTPYIAERDGHRAFLKAIDFTQALAADDPARALEELTRIFNFERDLVQACTSRGMRNIIRSQDEGSVSVPNGGPVPRVNYLIFELGAGDIRRVMRLSTDLDGAWAFRSLKDIALGLTQLHSVGIAHQDVKPSNVVAVDGRFKLADLGRASQRGTSGPFDATRCAGDPNYVTPEQMYGFQLNDWDARRRAVDLYHLGSMLLFLLTGVTASAGLVSNLAEAHLPPPWALGAGHSTKSSCTCERRPGE